MFTALRFQCSNTDRAQEGGNIEFNWYTGFRQYCLNFHYCSLDDIWKNFDSPQDHFEQTTRINESRDKRLLDAELPHAGAAPQVGRQGCCEPWWQAQMGGHLGLSAGLGVMRLGEKC